MKVLFAAAAMASSSSLVAVVLAGPGSSSLNNPCLAQGGAPLAVQKCDPANVNQQWAFANGNMVRAADATQCVSTSNFSTADMARLVVAPCHPTDKQPGHNNQAFACVRACARA